LSQQNQNQANTPPPPKKQINKPLIVVLWESQKGREELSFSGPGIMSRMVNIY
jgi:hypothetical protein